MKRLKALGFRFGGLLAAFALIVGVASTQAICVLTFHQPKVPAGMKKYVNSRR